VICWAGHGFAEPLSTFHIEAQTGVRWYLYFFFVCRALSFGVFAPCLSALQRCGKTAVGVGSTAMVLFWFAVAWMGETKTSDGTSGGRFQQRALGMRRTPPMFGLWHGSCQESMRVTARHWPIVLYYLIRRCCGTWRSM